MVSSGARTLPRRLLAMGTALAALYLILLTGQRALEAYRLQQQVEDVRREIHTLRARNVSLQTELADGRLDEDIERIAREELGLIRPGDHPVILIWPDAEEPPAAPNGTVSAEPEPSWHAWLRLFIDMTPDLR